MKLTMVVESRPPLRHEPTGTSATRRRATLSRKSSRNAAGSGLPSALSLGAQYGVLESGAVRGPVSGAGAGAAAPPAPSGAPAPPSTSGTSTQAAAGTW